MIPEEIQAIRERRSKITPPPWILAPEKCGPDGQGIYQEATGGPICEVGDPYPRGENHPQENMEFIAHAPEDIDKLLAEVERLTHENTYHSLQLDRAREEIERLRGELQSTQRMNEKRWQDAIEHAREYLGYYKEIGPAGVFGAVTISHNITRYENGERTPELLEELEGIK